MIVSELLWRGRIVSNYNEDILVNNAAKTRTLTVPANKRWLLAGVGHLLNGDDVTRNCKAEVFDESDKFICNLLRNQAITAAAIVHIPNMEENDEQARVVFPFFLYEGWYVKITWAAGGASAGGTATSALPILEIES